MAETTNTTTNTHLLQITAGNKDAVAYFTLDAVQLGSAGSGHVPPGRYALSVRSAAWVHKKDNTGKINLDVVKVITAPAKYAGVQIRSTHPAPVGDPGTNKGYNFVPAMVASSISVDPDKLAGMKAAKVQVAFTPSLLVGKTVFATLEDDEYEGKTKSSVGGYISKSDFDAMPGPATGDFTASSAPTGVIGGSVQPVQATIPVAGAQVIQMQQPVAAPAAPAAPTAPAIPAGSAVAGW
jgi:hypothetical protein